MVTRSTSKPVRLKDPDFPKRAREHKGGIIVAGFNYGQGSSREHASLAPLYLGVKAVIAKSFARIHMANLINAGIIPITFENQEDYDKFDTGCYLIAISNDITCFKVYVLQKVKIIK